MKGIKNVVLMAFLAAMLIATPATMYAQVDQFRYTVADNLGNISEPEGTSDRDNDRVIDTDDPAPTRPDEGDEGADNVTTETDSANAIDGDIKFSTFPG